MNILVAISAEHNAAVSTNQEYSVTVASSGTVNAAGSVEI